MSGRRGWKRVLRLGDAERDLDEELAYHRDRTLAELEAAGLSRAAAEREARRRFGDERQWRRELERQDRWARARATVVERAGVARDLIWRPIRTLVRSPALSAGIVVTFALGVGANAVMFGVVDRLLLRPPAHVKSPDQVRRVLVERATVGMYSTVGTSAQRTRQASEVLAYPDVRDLEALPAFDGVAAYTNRDLVVGRGGGAMEARGLLVTGDYFRTLGVRPVLGRFFGAAEDRLGGDRVAVIGHGFWQRRFGGGDDAIGQLLDLNLPGGPFEVVGVAPRSFTGVDLRSADIWLPLLAAHPAAETVSRSRNWYFLRGVARVAPDVAIEAAAARSTLAHRHGRAESVEAGAYDAEAEIVLSPLLAARGPLASDESAVAKWLAGVSLLVLLIACANVANLLLTRGARRGRETAVRLALGASRARISGEMLVEGLALALAGGVAALVVARWGGALVHGLLLPDLAGAGRLDGRIIGFTVTLAAVAGAAATLLPIAQARRGKLTGALRAGGRGSIGGGGSRLRSTLSALQAALSVVLLVGAGLFIRSLDRVTSVELGFEPAGVLMVEPVGDGLDGQARGPLLDMAKERLAALGPIESAAVVGASSPFWSEIVTELRLSDGDSLPHIPGGYPRVHMVDADYFETMRLAVRRGRGIESADGVGATPVVVVNEVMAEQLWPGEQALGQCLHIADGPCAEVVGIVENAHLGRVPEDPPPQYYVSLAQGLVDSTPAMVVLRVRSGDHGGTVPAIRSAMAELDSRVRYANVTPLDDLIAPYTRSWTLGASLFTAFGLLALLVAGIGLYSVLAYEVARQRPEIGLRSALGAGRNRIVRDVVVRAMKVATLGLAVGLAAAVVLGPRIRDLLYETSPRDPATLVGVVGTLLAVALAAAAIPAFRASRVDPSEALRAE